MTQQKVLSTHFPSTFPQQEEPMHFQRACLSATEPRWKIQVGEHLYCIRMKLKKTHTSVMAGVQTCGSQINFLPFLLLSAWLCSGYKFLSHQALVDCGFEKSFLSKKQSHTLSEMMTVTTLNKDFLLISPNIISPVSIILSLIDQLVGGVISFLLPVFRPPWLQLRILFELSSCFP